MTQAPGIHMALIHEKAKSVILPILFKNRANKIEVGAGSLRGSETGRNTSSRDVRAAFFAVAFLRFASGNLEIECGVIWYFGAMAVRPLL